MKVFWAWQSDHPGKISRHFVRDALAAAIEILREPQDIEEPTEAARRDALHLDHDRLGLRGFKDLAAEIFRKIAASSVFVADVSPVGQTPPTSADDGKEYAKPLMNPNVAIELGYAIGSITEDRVLAVLNAAFGTRDSLPFDIRHKDGVILYKLARDATREEIKQESRKLTSILVEALRPFVESDTLVGATPPTIRETLSTTSTAFFSNPGDVLADLGSELDRISYTISHDPAFYLRIIPMADRVMPLRQGDLLSKAQTLGAFGLNFGGLNRTNTYGMICIDPDGNDGQIASLTQAFRNGELWGINRNILAQGARRSPALIPSRPMEAVLYNSIRKYAAFQRSVSGVEPPFIVEAGIVGVKDWTLAITVAAGVQYLDPMYKGEVVLRQVLRELTDETMDVFLLSFFEQVFRQTGHPRPAGLYNFPGPNAYAR
jgi:hypothetical protein